MMTDLRVRFPKPCRENWETMTPTGRHRFCETCDKVVHDLVQYDAAEIQELMRREPDSCVRASIDASGIVAAKHGNHGNFRRIVAVAGASAGLLISQPSLSENQHSVGEIVGTTLPFGQKTAVTAKDEKGISYRTKVRSNGRYKIKRIPPGVYALEFSSPDCGSWTVQNVVVGSGETIVANEPENDQFCIIVGLLEIEHDGNNGQS